jgi:hypothetical protein
LTLKIDGFDDAIIGPAFVWDSSGTQTMVLVYDAEMIRDLLMSRDGMDFGEAREYIEYNIEGAYMGPMTPVLVWKHDEFYGEMDD